MNATERHARKQVLLTRIAFARNEMRRDVAQLKHAAQLPQLLRAAIGDRFGGGMARSLLASAQKGDWLGTGLAWLRRYRLAASLLGSVSPLLRGGGRWGRWLRIAALAGTGWFGWRAVRNRGSDGQREP